MRIFLILPALAVLFACETAREPAGGPPMSISNNWTRLCVARHNMAINVGFMVGHVSTVPLPDLWTLPWHREWDVNLVNFDKVRADIKARYKG